MVETLDPSGLLQVFKGKKNNHHLSEYHFYRYTHNNILHTERKDLVLFKNHGKLVREYRLYGVAVYVLSFVDDWMYACN